MTTSLDKAQWQALAAQLSPEGRCFINGAYVDFGLGGDA